MNLRVVERIVNAVLYEGYILYPYRASAVKNRQRFNFGALYPAAYAEAQSGADRASMQTECLVRAAGRATVDVNVRFLHLVSREMGVPMAGYPDLDAQDATADSRLQFVESLEVEGQLFQTWQEAVERDVRLPGLGLNDLIAEPGQAAFTFPAQREAERLRDTGGHLAGVIVRRQELIAGTVEASAAALGDELYKLTVRILNRATPADEKLRSRDAVLAQSLLSTHTILSICDGEFVSLLDPPDDLRETAASCQNLGTWPVLVGAEGERDCMLSSPIILYDYPQIAPESHGDLFDGTEIDEILTLRIMTLTDDEKRQMRGVDERARQVLERTETIPAEQMWKMHGAVRGLRRLKEGER